jgi:hypothetical protein
VKHWTQFIFISFLMLSVAFHVACNPKVLNPTLASSTKNVDLPTPTPTATGGNAVILNNGGDVSFYDNSTAGNVTIGNGSVGVINFSNAGSATITDSGTLTFLNPTPTPTVIGN